MFDKKTDKLLLNLRQDAQSFARAGGESTLNYFNKTYDLEFKSDLSPVTTADRESETIIRDAIRKKYPEHGIIGEEFGSEGEEREIVWVIDPIDGTQSFIHGVPFYTTLIGILIEGIPRVGVIYAPALKEMVIAATGHGALLNGRSCQTRSCNDLKLATFLTTDISNIREHNFVKPYEDLLEQTRIFRTWGDAYGHLMVATGRADIMFDPVLSIWDAAALLPVITEAGGVYGDVKGNRTIESGNALSCGAGIHQDVIEVFNKKGVK